MSWTATIASGIFGIPLGFLTIIIVSLATEAPPREIQDFVTNIRYPESGKAIAPPTFGKKDPAMGGAEPSAI